MKYLFFVIILLSLFGPKIGIIDVSTLVAISSTVLLVHKKRNFLVHEYLVYIAILITLFCYSLYLYSFTATNDTYVMLRCLRALLSSVFLGFVFYNTDLKFSVIFDLLIAVLCCNALSILLQILIPETQYILSAIYGFNKNFAKYRAFGLTTGYDTAGYLCVIGAILSAAKSYYNNGRFIYIVTLTLFIVAAFFTSRSSMLLMLVVTLTVLFFFLVKGGPALKGIASIYLFFILCALVFYVLPLLLSTFLGVTDLPFTYNISDINYNESFAQTNLEDWQQNMWIMPETLSDLFFGTGRNIESSDVGYIKLIFMIGIIGSVIVFISYAFLTIKMIKIQIGLKTKQMHHSELLIYASLFILIIIFIFIFNIKNLYFLTRTYHELIVIMFFSILREYKNISSLKLNRRTQ